MMDLVIGGRGSGKTLELIKRVHNKPAYIVTRSVYAADRIASDAREFGCNILYPITYGEFLTGRSVRGGHDIKFMIDDLDHFLAFIAHNREVVGVTLDVDTSNIVELEEKYQK